MLIVRLPRRRWSLPLVEEEEDDRMRWRSSQCPSLGCLALGAKQRPKGGMEWNALSFPPRSPKVRPYPLYKEIGQVHGGLGSESTVYMRWSLGRPCSDALWTVAVSWSQRSLGRRLTALFGHSVCQAMST
jgi:hypothetical protein